MWIKRKKVKRAESQAEEEGVEPKEGYRVAPEIEENDEWFHEALRLEPEEIKHKLRSKDATSLELLELTEKARMEEDPDQVWENDDEEQVIHTSRLLAFGGLLVLVVLMVIIAVTSGPDEEEILAEAQAAQAEVPMREFDDKAPDLLTELKDLTEGYFAATSWQGRIPFLREEQNLLDKIESLDDRQTQDFEAIEVVGLRLLPTARSLIGVETQPLMVSFNRKKPEFLLCVKLGGKWKIDWSASAGFQEVDWDALDDAEPGTKLRVRASLSPDHLYLGSFPEREYYSVKLFLPRREEGVYAYVPRGEPDALWLREAFNVSEGRSEKVMALIEVELKEKSLGRWMVEITQVINNSWVAPVDGADK